MSRLEPLELEHILGFTGHYAGTLACDPTSDDRYFAAMGAHIVSCDINNPHEQQFLRGHDAFVSSIDFSERGELLVSGQMYSPAAAGRDSPVIVWETLPDKETASASEAPARPVFELYGLTGGVAIARLSPDARFLAAAGQDGVVMVWDMRTGEQVALKRFDQDSAGTGAGTRPMGCPVEFIAWGPVEQLGRRPGYTLCVGARGTHVFMCPLRFDPRAMAYVLGSERASLPSTGLRRGFTPAAVCTPEGDLVAGTTAGEMAVFSLEGRSFVGVFPVTTGGLTALALAADASVLAGGGDGSVRRFSGAGRDWVCTGEARGGDGALGAAVTSLSVSRSGAWVLAGTATGSIVRIAVPVEEGDSEGRKRGAEDKEEGEGEFPWEVLERSHGARVHAVAFGAGRPDVVATGADDGEVLVWDLSDYYVLMRALVSAGGTGVGGGRTSKAAPPGATALALVPSGGAAGERGGRGPLADLAGVLSGWEDGKLRMHAPPGAAEDLPTGAARMAKRSTRTTSAGALAVARSSAEAPLADAQWELDAHRGAVRAVQLQKSYILSGGDDGRVCVWARGTRELLLQFSEHKGPCTGAIADAGSPSLVHSVGQDRCVFTYDLRSERRVGGFALPSRSAAAFTALAQRPTGERELVSGQKDGRLLLWDPDTPERPVAEAREAPAVAVLAAAVSPSGELLAAATGDGALRVYMCGDVGEAAGAGAGLARGPGSSEMPLAYVRAAHSGACTSVQWSPDERQIVTGGADCCVCVYNLYSAGAGVGAGGDGGSGRGSIADSEGGRSRASGNGSVTGSVPGSGRGYASAEHAHGPGPSVPERGAEAGGAEGVGLGHGSRRRAGDASSSVAAHGNGGRGGNGRAGGSAGEGGRPGPPPSGRPPVPPLRTSGGEGGIIAKYTYHEDSDGRPGERASSRSSAAGSRHSSRGSGRDGATRPW